jgi:hypothetical protein
MPDSSGPTPTASLFKDGSVASNDARFVKQRALVAR